MKHRKIKLRVEFMICQKESEGEVEIKNINKDKRPIQMRPSQFHQICRLLKPRRDTETPKQTGIKKSLQNFMAQTFVGRKAVTKCKFKKHLNNGTESH